MDLVSIEAPSPRVTLPGKPPKFLNTLFRIVAARQLLQVVANQLIEALRESRRHFPARAASCSSIELRIFTCTVYVCTDYVSAAA